MDLNENSTQVQSLLSSADKSIFPAFAVSLISCFLLSIIVGCIDSPIGGLINTETRCVRQNVPGLNGEWRNGALTLQAVRVDSNGVDQFTTDQSYSDGGVQGTATSGLLWEATLFWHWRGRSCYGDSDWFMSAGDE